MYPKYIRSGISHIENWSASGPNDRVMEMDMIPRYHLLLAMVILAVALPLHAQGGCVDSPESPTIVLALVGGIGIIATGIRASRKRKS